MKQLLQASWYWPILTVTLWSSLTVAGTPTVKSMKYVSHWTGESDPWADITVTVTPPDNGAILPSNAKVQIKTVFVLGSRKDLFCHIKDYFAYSALTNIDSAGWNALATKAGTTTGCPNDDQPFHLVEFDLPLTATNGQHSSMFHIYSDGRAGFCPRPDSKQRASLKISGKISWNTSGGMLQTSTVVIDSLEQPHDLDGCPDANSQTANFPARIVERPDNFDSFAGRIMFADTSSKSVQTSALPRSCVAQCPPAVQVCSDCACCCPCRHRYRIGHRRFRCCR